MCLDGTACEGTHFAQLQGMLPTKTYFVQLQFDLMHLLQPACAACTSACFDRLFQPAGCWHCASRRSSPGYCSRPQVVVDANVSLKKTPNKVAQHVTGDCRLQHYAGVIPLARDLMTNYSYGTRSQWVFYSCNKSSRLEAMQPLCSDT